MTGQSNFIVTLKPKILPVVGSIVARTHQPTRDATIDRLNFHNRQQKSLIIKTNQSLREKFTVRGRTTPNRSLLKTEMEL